MRSKSVSEDVEIRILGMAVCRIDVEHNLNPTSLGTRLIASKRNPTGDRYIELSWEYFVNIRPIVTASAHARC